MADVEVEPEVRPRVCLRLVTFTHCITATVLVLCGCVCSPWVPSQYECVVCRNVLVDPVTVMCGHSCCKRCAHLYSM